MPRQPKSESERRGSDPEISRRAFAKWKREAAGEEYFAEALAVLKQAGKVSRRAYLELMFEMEEKYPGRGWRDQIDELEAFYFKYKLELKEHPRMREIIEKI